MNVDPRLKPDIFKQRVPCVDCPFRKVGGVRHGKYMLASYISYFTTMPGSMFPCHKSVPPDVDRNKWTEWQDGQVVCAGGLLFAAKQRTVNVITAIGIALGWYNPHVHTPEELDLVFDSADDMLTGIEQRD